MDERDSSGDDSPRSFRFRKPDDLYQLRVQLLEIDPPIWRRVVVLQDTPLPLLHHVLQIAMGWTDSHLHQFKVGEVRFGEPDDEYPPGPIDYTPVTLNQLAPSSRSRFVYEYDFGDSWEHEIVLEEELPVESVTGQVPRCLDGERACPPEDSGGAHGYSELLAELRDPAHSDHEASRVWAGRKFNSEAFDIDSVNKRLARYVRRPRSTRASSSPRKRG